MNTFKYNIITFILGALFYIIVFQITPLLLFNSEYYFFNKIDPEIESLNNKRDSVKKEYDLFLEKEYIKKDIKEMQYYMKTTCLLDSITKIISYLSKERDTISIPTVKIDTIPVYKIPM